MGTQRLVDKEIELARINGWMADAQADRTTSLSTVLSYLVTFSAMWLATWATVGLTFLVQGVFMKFIWLLIALLAIPFIVVVILTLRMKAEIYRRYQNTMAGVYHSLDELEKAVLISYDERTQGRLS